jgi:hypothetical protein
MSYYIYNAAKGYQPIYRLPDALILLGGRTLYWSDPELRKFEPICKLPHEKSVARIPGRLIARIFRRDADSAALIDADHLLIARRSKIYKICLSTGVCTVDLMLPNGARLLHLSPIHDRETGVKAICFGEYSTRFDGGAINIWRRGTAPDDAWAISGTFAAGEIDHVHNICQARDGTIRILTGDFDAAAGIWQSDFALSTFTPIARGSQDVRACWIWQSPDDALYFATDSQFDTNHLRVIEHGAFGDVAPIIGSSIHACSDATRLIFSTAVEPGAVTGKKLRDILDRVPGPGIASNEAAIYLFDGAALTAIHSEAKDRWPMRLAQFGTFRFPGGTMPADGFYAYGVGVTDHDGHCLYFRR